MRLPMAPPTAPTPLPTPLATVPTASNVPVSGVVMVSVSLRLATTNGPRVTLKLSCALVRSCDSGFCGLPDRLRGACASSASRIAVNAIAVGASTVDVPVSGCNGGNAASVGRVWDGPGEEITVNSAAAAPETTTASKANRIVRRRMAALAKLARIGPEKSGKVPQRQFSGFHYPIQTGQSCRHSGGGAESRESGIHNHGAGYSLRWSRSRWRREYGFRVRPAGARNDQGESDVPQHPHAV